MEFIINNLSDAVFFCDIDKIIEYIHRGADVNALNEQDDVTCLYSSCVLGKLSIVRILIDAGASVDIGSSDGETPLIGAAGQFSLARSGLSHPPEMEANLLEIVKILIQNGADVNAIRKDGWNALIAAANAGSFQAVSLLLQAGANVNIQTSSGETPLSRTKEALKNYKSIWLGGSPRLNINLKKDYQRIIQLLLEFGATDSESNIAQEE
jgi:uncharacterized protein